jgi:hypothetical protein
MASTGYAAFSLYRATRPNLKKNKKSNKGEKSVTQENTGDNRTRRYPLRSGFTHGLKDNPSLASVTPNAAPMASAPQRKMVKREAPEMVEFKAHGDLLEGKLISALKVKIKDKKTGQPKMVMEYTFLGEDRKTRKCLGSYDLDTKIFPTDVGFWAEITYVADKDVPSGKMRIFDVSFEEIVPSAAFADGTQITDADIPF